MQIQSRQKKKKLVNIDVNTGKVLVKAKEQSTARKQAIIYCRVSSPKQVKEGDGLHSQEMHCRERCSRNNADVVRVFTDEGVSGTNLERAGLNGAIAYLQEQNKQYIKVHYFVCTEESRISRSSNLLETLDIDDKIIATGADLAFTFSGGAVNSEDDGQKAWKQIKYVVASQELNKIRKRGITGKINKLKEGRRPFRSIVVGYQKIKQGGQSFVIKDEMADIVKKGFELYANDVLVTDTDLYKYWVQEGLRTEDSRFKGKIHFSFIGKQFDIQRLYFYAGMIYSPTYLDEPVEAMHEAIIDMTVFSKIVKKVYGSTKLLSRKPKETNDHFVFPLKGLLRCPDCGHIIQAWNTENNVGKLYPYYGCCTKGCKLRANVSQVTAESQFYEFLDGLKLPEEVLNVFEALIASNREQKQQMERQLRKTKFARIEQIQARQNEIEQSMHSITIPKLRAKVEDERANLDNEMEELQRDLEQKEFTDNVLLDLISKVKAIFVNPLAFWELGNYDMRKLLIDVRFGGNLYYSKEGGYRTKEKTGLHQYFHAISDSLVASLADDETRTRNLLHGKETL